MSEIKKQSTIKDMLLATISEHIDQQNAKGLKKYGESLDECPVEDFDWQRMALEEMVDALQYQQKEISRLNALIPKKELVFRPALEIHKLDASQIKELIKALQGMEQHIYSPDHRNKPDLSDFKPNQEPTPSEALNIAAEEWSAIKERDEIIEDLQDENKGLREEIKELKTSRYEWRQKSYKANDEIVQLRSLIARSWGVN